MKEEREGRVVVWLVHEGEGGGRKWDRKLEKQTIVKEKKRRENMRIWTVSEEAVVA